MEKAGRLAVYGSRDETFWSDETRNSVGRGKVGGGRKERQEKRLGAGLVFFRFEKFDGHLERARLRIGSLGKRGVGFSVAHVRAVLAVEKLDRFLCFWVFTEFLQNRFSRAPSSALGRVQELHGLLKRQVQEILVFGDASRLRAGFHVRSEPSQVLRNRLAGFSPDAKLFGQREKRKRRCKIHLLRHHARKERFHFWLVGFFSFLLLSVRPDLIRLAVAQLNVGPIAPCQDVHRLECLGIRSKRRGTLGLFFDHAQSILDPQAVGSHVFGDVGCFTVIFDKRSVTSNTHV